MAKVSSAAKLNCYARVARSAAFRARRSWFGAYCSSVSQCAQLDRCELGQSDLLTFAVRFVGQQRPLLHVTTRSFQPHLATARNHRIMHADC